MNKTYRHHVELLLKNILTLSGIESFAISVGAMEAPKHQQVERNQPKNKHRKCVKKLERFIFQR